MSITWTTQGMKPDISNRIRSVDTLGVLRQHTRALWEAALKAEGFGQIQKYDNLSQTSSPNINVDWELDSLMEFQVLQSFMGRSKFDMSVREMAVVEYASPIYSVGTLARCVIPRISFLPKIIRNLSMLYRLAPTRWIGEGDDEQSATLAAAMDDAGIRSASKRWYESYKVHGTTLVRPVLSTKWGRPAMAFEVRTPNECRVMLGDDGAVEKVLCVQRMEQDGFREYGIIVWTDEEHYWLDTHGKRHPVGENDAMVNPYGVVPYTVINASEELYGAPMTDALDACLYSNLLRLALTDDVMFSALGVWLVKNLEWADGKAISPRQIFHADKIQQGEGYPESPSIESVTGTPHSALISDLMTEIYKQAAVNEGISPAMLENQIREMSGKALREMKSEVIDQRINDAEIMEEAERDIAWKFSVVGNHHAGAGELPQWQKITFDPAEYHIDFPDEITDDTDPDKAYELKMKKVNDGLLSIVDVFMEENPDIDDEEDALERIAQNKAQVKRLTGAGLRTGFFADLMNTKEEAKPKDGVADILDTES